MKYSSNIVKHHETLEHASFDATISALDAEMSALGAATSAIARSYGDIGAEFPTISAIAELV